MKTIENKTTTIPMGNEGPNATYADLIKAVCNQPVHGGYSITDISMRTAIIKACDKANGEIELEDARVDYLKAISATAKFNILHEDIVEFSESIKNDWKKIN